MTGPAAVAAAAHVFVADLWAPALEPDDAHHLRRVLRLRPGDTITVSDGRGSWRLCSFGPVLTPLDEGHRLAAPQPELTIAFSLIKGPRPEWTVQKLTELGVDRIVPFVADRSIVRWDGDRARRNHERLAAIARAAAMQSRRAWLPVVEPVSSFAAVGARPGAALADRGGDPPSLTHPTVLVGPEGGWSDAEREAVGATVGLGETVLRAETAAVAVGSVLIALRSDAVRHKRTTQR